MCPKLRVWTNAHVVPDTYATHGIDDGFLPKPEVVPNLHATGAWKEAALVDGAEVANLEELRINPDVVADDRSVSNGDPTRVEDDVPSE